MKDTCSETLLPIIPTVKDRVLKPLTITQVIMSVMFTILFGLLRIVIPAISL